jgi:hypothetical protein
MISLCCLCILPSQFLNAKSNHCETWHVYHGTWVHLNGILHKSFIVRKWLSKEYVQQQMNCWMHHLHRWTQRLSCNTTCIMESLWVHLYIPSFRTCTAEVVVWRLPETSGCTKCSWVPWDTEPRITVLVRTSSNLLDWIKLCIPPYHC